MIHDGFTIGCIGLGNMGGAILSGLSGTYAKELLLGYDKDQQKGALLSSHITLFSDVQTLAKKSDVLIIAVKPDMVASVLKEISESVDKALIISIAAGVTIQSIESAVGSNKKIIRAMPNTPAMTGEGMTVLSPNANTDGADIARAEDIFSIIGRTAVMPEKYLNAVTALSGSGPAYIFTMIHAMADAGVLLGIPRDKAVLLAAQTAKGAAQMVLTSGEDPMSLRGKVTSPGGTTIAAIHVMERAGFSGIIMDAIEEACFTAEQLGEKK
jgi:pyrroline-5-carboxylate reductase